MKKVYCFLKFTCLIFIFFFKLFNCVKPNAAPISLPSTLYPIVSNTNFAFGFGIAFFKKGKYNKEQVKKYVESYHKDELDAYYFYQTHGEVCKQLHLKNKNDFQFIYIQYLERKYLNWSFNSLKYSSTIYARECKVNENGKSIEKGVTLKDNKGEIERFKIHDIISVKFNQEVNGVYFMKNGKFMRDSLRVLDFDVSQYDCFYGIASMGCNCNKNGNIAFELW